MRRQGIRGKEESAKYDNKIEHKLTRPRGGIGRRKKVQGTEIHFTGGK